MERAELRQLLHATGAAVDRGGFTFLRDLQWGAAELKTFEELTPAADALDAEQGWLCIPTGGTSGQIRFARHDESTISAAVSGFCLHTGARRVNAVGVLPMHHVSGLMSRLRCASTGGEYVQWDWKQLASGNYPSVNEGVGSGDWFLSLVPTQLQRLLERPDGADFLKRFRTVFLGGGPTWPALAEAAAVASVPVALSYGMTETAAMIAAQTPADFLAGSRDAGRPMPHVQIEIVDQAETERSEASAAGRIRVKGESVFRGYFPAFDGTRTYDTEDLGRFNAAGALEVLGRRDSGIITGGKKVWPTEVEAALLATGFFQDVAVLGLPDSIWGQKVVACYPAGAEEVSPEKIKLALAASLSPYKHPKQFIAVTTWPRNAQGKLSRTALKATIREAM